MTLDLNTARGGTEHVEVEGDVFEEDVRIRQEPLQPSVKGQVIECNYKLEVKLRYGGLDCCRTVPECELPLCLYTREMEIPPPQPMMPPQW